MTENPSFSQFALYPSIILDHDVHVQKNKNYLAFPFMGFMKLCFVAILKICVEECNGKQPFDFGFMYL